MVVLRPFQETDAPFVTALLQDLWGHDMAMLHTYQLHQIWEASSLIRQTLVAVAQEQVVGVGTIFESTNHPLRLYVVINVAADWQRQGIGTALYHALQALGDGRPWQAKALRRDTAGMGFLTKHGFFPLMHTLLGRIHPRSEPVQSWLQTLPATVPGIAFIALSNPTCSVSRAQFALMLAQVYRRYHAWSLPAPFSEERAIDLFAGSDFLTESAICAMANGQFCGGVALYTHDEPKATALANFGVIEQTGRADSAITAALIRRCVAWAAEHDVLVHFEADVSYIPHRVIFETAPADQVERDFLNLVTGEK